MNASTLMILLSMRDEASAPIGNFSKTLEKNRAALMTVGRSVTYLGTSLMSMGVTLRAMDNPMAKNISNMFLFVGGIATAIGTAGQFIGTIGRMSKALKELAASEALVKMFQGPAGWATLAVGGALATGLAVGAVASVNKSNSTSTKVTATIENRIYLDSEQIGDSSRKQTIMVQERNATSGVK